MINLNKSQKINTRLSLTIGSVLIVFGIVVIVLLNYSMRREALKEAEEKAKILLDQNLATHTFFSKQLKPDVFKLVDTWVSKEYFEPSWMSSTYAVREIDKYFKSLNGSDYYYKESAINARSIENEADEYEANFLKRLNQEPDLSYQSKIRTIDGAPYFTVLRRGEVLEKGCLRCHSTPDNAPSGLVKLYGSERSFNRTLGEVISTISIRVPIIVPYEQAKALTIQLSVIFLLVLILLFTIQFWFNKRYILSPINEVREKAFQITNDESKLGDQISLSKSNELNELIKTFNSMSYNLAQSRDLLLDRVQERTIELSTANEDLKKEVHVRMVAEEQTQASLKEKETLLQEIHHRVKNNLTVISSLLKLQANGMEDERLKEALKESQNRIYAMSAVHESLYSSENLAEIELKTYIAKISGTLIQTYSTNPRNVKLNTDSEEIKIGIKQASPIGLIINELISNSLKYAFPDDKTGEITVIIQKLNNELELIVMDDGIGIPDGFDWKNSKSLGLKLVRTLVENQLDGSIDMESNNGIKFTIKFNIET